MATMVKLDDEWHAYAEELVRDGHFASVEQAVEAGLRRIEAELDDEEDAETDAAIRQGLADADAGRSIDGELVFERLLQRYRQSGAA